MTTSDVLIVGGGPAGSTCAWQLHRAGLDVTIVDRAMFPRDKVCAGWITPQAVAALQLDAAAYAEHHTFQPFAGFRVGLVDGKPGTRIVYDRPVSFGIRRCEFDHHLLQRSGARLVLGARVSSIRRDRGTWVVNETLRAPMLVGAGGAGCPVANMLNGDRAARPPVVAREAESLFADHADGAPVGAAEPELFFCRDLKGYGWCVRKGAYVNVGLGRLDPRSLPAATARFVASLESRHTIPSRVPWRWRGHAYAVYTTPRPRIVDAGVLLVGDAAAVADLHSGEGIRQAIESGLLAAETIVEASGQFSRRRLDPYAARVRARFAETGAPVLGALMRALPVRAKTAIANCLLDLPVFVRRIVIDEWFLHRRQPVLFHP